MKRLFLPFIFLFAGALSYAQEMAVYKEYIQKAEELYDIGQYLESAKSYSKAFESINGIFIPIDRYNAACAWSLANEKDSSFNQLFKLVKNLNYKDLTHTLADEDLDNLHQDERWNEVIALMRANKEKAEAKLNKPLIKILDSIYVEDQKYRMQLEDSINKQYGWESKEVRAQWKIINEKDSLNLIIIKKILDEYGWLGADIVGVQGNTTLFLVIQHADLKTQLHYLPLMREAVKKGNARPSSLALLEDRTALGQGKHQIFGSQLWTDSETGELFVAPLIDPENVDQRRKEVGLSTLSEYLQHWQLKWNVAEYLQKLPQYEAKLKNKHY
jgi:hypothetical protein